MWLRPVLGVVDERVDAVAGALGFARASKVEETGVAALLTCGDAVARRGHAFHDGVEQGHRTPLGVGVDEEVESPGRLLQTDVAVQRHARPGEECEVVDGAAWSSHVPVDHRDEVPALDDPVVGAGVVVADDLAVVGLGHSPAPLARTFRLEPFDDVVEVTQPRDRFGEHVVQHHLAVDRDAPALDIGEHLSPVVVEPVQLRHAAESLLCEVRQQLVHGWCPRPGRAAHGAPDPGRATDVPGEVLRLVTTHVPIVSDMAG